MPLIPIQHHGAHSSLSFFLICNSFLWQWEIWLSLYMIYYLYAQHKFTHSAVSEFLTHSTLKNKYTNSSTIPVVFWSSRLLPMIFIQNILIQSDLGEGLSSPFPSVWLCHSFLIQPDSFPTVYFPFWVPPTFWLTLLIYCLGCGVKHWHGPKSQNYPKAILREVSLFSNPFYVGSLPGFFLPTLT